MKNANQPALPCLMQKIGEEEFRAHKPNDPKEWIVPCSGLSKREYFAGIFYASIISKAPGASISKEFAKQMAMSAINCADELLEELYKTQQA